MITKRELEKLQPTDSYSRDPEKARKEKHVMALKEEIKREIRHTASNSTDSHVLMNLGQTLRNASLTLTEHEQKDYVRAVYTLKPKRGLTEYELDILDTATGITSLRSILDESISFRVSATDEESTNTVLAYWMLVKW